MLQSMGLQRVGHDLATEKQLLSLTSKTQLPLGTLHLPHTLVRSQGPGRPPAPPGPCLSLPLIIFPCPLPLGLWRSWACLTAFCKYYCSWRPSRPLSPWRSPPFSAPKTLCALLTVSMTSALSDHVVFPGTSKAVFIWLKPPGQAAGPSPWPSQHSPLSLGPC